MSHERGQSWRAGFTKSSLFLLSFFLPLLLVLFLIFPFFFFFFVSINPRHFFGKDCLSDESMSNPSHRGSKKRGIKTLSGMMTPTQADVKRDVFGGRSTPTPPIDFFFLLRLDTGRERSGRECVQCT